MQIVHLYLEGADDEWQEAIKGRNLVPLPDWPLDVALLKQQMASGLSGVAIKIDLPKRLGNKTSIILITPLSQFANIVMAFRAKVPEEFIGGPLEVKEWEPTPQADTVDADLSKHVTQALGSAAVCWTNLQTAGMFLTEQADRIGNELINYILTNFERKSD